MAASRIARSLVNRHIAADRLRVYQRERDRAIETGTINPFAGASLPGKLWAQTYFPNAVKAGFVVRHDQLWNWFDNLTPGVAPQARVSPWPRGGGKSTSGELGVVHTGVKLTRRFALIVSETQPQADKHVQDIGSRFEELGIGRSISKYGSSKGWRRDQLRTENGYNVAGFGLLTSGRGIKFEDFRPDLIVFDDIDNRHDSEAMIRKKIEIITQTILPAGSADVAVLFLQNPMHKNSIMQQLIDGRADFLLNREVTQAEPAVIGLTFQRVLQDDGSIRYVVTGGVPTWEGQNLAIVEFQINLWGPRAFLREAQHRLDEEEGGLWSKSRDIEPFRVTYAPPLIRVGIGIDPSATSGGDEAGIVAAGVAYIGGVLHGYVLDDSSKQGSPRSWALAAVAAHHKFHGTIPMVAESNNGGEMVEITIGTVDGHPPVEIIHASRGKITRAEPVQSLYELGRVHHVGEFDKLERELCTWQPGDPSPNRLDALVWIITKLMVNVPSTEVYYPKPGQGIAVPNTGAVADWQRNMDYLRNGR